MKILLDQNQLAFYIGLPFEVTSEGVYIDNGVNPVYTSANTSVIDAEPPSPPLNFVWKWENGVWVCVDQPTVDAYLQAQKDAENAEQRKKRGDAYREQADPIFFKAQRGEATIDEWQAKVEQIKARYPYQE